MYSFIHGSVPHLLSDIFTAYVKILILIEQDKRAIYVLSNYYVYKIKKINLHIQAWLTFVVALP